MKYEFVCNYAKNEVLRKSLTKLAQQTFWIDLEAWYQSGEWDENHVPYSYVDGEEVVSSVLANKMKIMVGQKEYLFIQIGTVMTKKEYRGQGLLRKIIERVISDYKDKVDGFYLYANDTVKEFYPRFGFKVGYEYVYYRDIVKTNRDGLIQPMKDCTDSQRKEFLHIRDNCIKNEMVSADNKALLAFWTDSLEEIYYLPEQKCYVGAEFEGDTLLLKQIFSTKREDVNNIIDTFGGKADKVQLGFVPLDKTGFDVKKIMMDDYNYFYIGEVLDELEKQKVRMPEYSHA